jgi:hypothetical protein
MRNSSVCGASALDTSARTTQTSSEDTKPSTTASAAVPPRSDTEQQHGGPSTHTLKQAQLTRTQQQVSTDAHRHRHQRNARMVEQLDPHFEHHTRMDSRTHTREQHTPHDTTQHSTAQHSTTQHNTTQHNTTQHNTTQHNTTQHNTTQHNTTHHTTPQHNTHARTRISRQRNLRNRALGRLDVEVRRLDDVATCTQTRAARANTASHSDARGRTPHARVRRHSAVQRAPARMSTR